MTNWIFEHLDWIGYILFLIGMHRIGNNKIDGWFYEFVGSVMLIVLGLSIHKNGIVVFNILFALVAIVSYFKQVKFKVEVINNKTKPPNIAI